MRMKTIVSIEGNIGSGKTTLLRMIQERFPRLQFIKEPVDNWQKIRGVTNPTASFNLLEKYYQDPERWAFTFQINAILTRMAVLHQNVAQGTSHISFSERSITADRQIFARLLLSENKMSQMEFSIYWNMFRELDSLFKVPKVHRYIYLRTTPQKCLERIFTRGRPQQKSSISLQYLKKIHQLHETWLVKEKHLHNNNPVSVIDGNMEFQNNEDLVNKIIEEQILVGMSKEERDSIARPETKVAHF